MNASSPQKTPHPLQQLMQRVGLSSFRALSQAAEVSEKQIRRLRRGEVTRVRLETLLKLSQVLQISIAELVDILIPSQDQSPEGKLQNSESFHELESLRGEYSRLQQQLQQQKQILQQEFQQSSLQVLESLLLQLPTAAYTAQQNPQFPAVRLLPLLKPLEQLLQEWGIEAIAEVGSEVAYDPQLHQLMEGFAEAGDRVRVRYTGYRQGEKLLYRAKVSPVVKRSE